MARKPKQPKTIAAIKHTDAKRKNIPTAEYQSVLKEEDKSPIRVAYERRNPDLDPQLVWRGKDMLDWSDLVVPAPPLYIQEKIHPKVLIDDLQRESQKLATNTIHYPLKSISLPISTACRTRRRAPSFTSTMPTGATA